MLRLKALTASGALALALVAGPPMSSQASELTGDAMLSELKAGGYVIYFRHAISDTAQTDADPIKVGDCTTQRNLADDGRSQAKQIGATFQAQGIAVDKVFASAYCRTTETAALAFEGVGVEAAPALFYSLALPKDEAARAADELKRLLATQPQGGKNTVLVGHTSNIKEVAGVWPKKEGGAFVFKPDGNGGFTLAGSLEPTDIAKAGS